MDIQSTNLILTEVSGVPYFNAPIFIAMLALVCMSAFFSMSETVFSTCNTVKLTLLAEEGKKSAQKALWITQHYDRTITTLLVGNNIVNTTLSIISVTFFADLLINSPNLVEFVSVAAITIIVLIFGEITPKTIAKIYADSLALSLSYIIRFIEFLLFPIVIIFTGYQKLFHMKESEEDKEPQVNEQELQAILDDMEDEGAIESNEVEMINAVLSLNDREVKDIMTPRPDIVAISDDADIDDIKDLFFEAKFSRIPVYHDDKDNIVGILFERDFLTTYIKRKNFRLKTILRPVKYVSASMKVDDLFHELQKSKMHMAVVSGEYGEVIGLVTMEDALEEMVGEIYDEHDETKDEVLIQKVEDGEYIVNANIYVEDLFEDLELGKAPETQYSKLSGWLYGNCEDVPEEGFNYVYVSKFIHKTDDEDYEECTKKLTFVITKVEDRRILEAKLFVEDITNSEEDEDEE